MKLNKKIPIIKGAPPKPGNEYLIPGTKNSTLKNLSYELLYVIYKAFYAKTIDIQNKIHRMKYEEGTLEDRDQMQYIKTMEDYYNQLRKITQELKTHLN